MRTFLGLAIVLVAAPASAAPNAFWTFGFDLPRHGRHAPHFGEIRTPTLYADAASATTPSDKAGCARCDAAQTPELPAADRVAGSIGS